MAEKEDAKYSFTFNFNAPVGQNIAHVDKLEAHFDKDMTMQVVTPEALVDGTDEPLADADKPSRGPKKKYLFAKDEHGYVEDEPVKESEQERLMSYLRQHKLTSRKLVCNKDDTLNKTIVCFLKCWKERGMISDKASGAAIFRFLTDDCGLGSEVAECAYANRISEQFTAMKDKNVFDSVIYFDVKDCFKKNG